jgi:RHS repeat-associated protein
LLTSDRAALLASVYAANPGTPVQGQAVTNTYKCDKAGRLTEACLGVQPCGTTATTVTAAGTATKYTYTYDKMGNRTREVRPSQSISQTYDLDDQPVTQTNAGVTFTRLYSLRARDYDPTTGRFLQTDPLDIAEPSTGQSTYIYGANNPLTNVDPSGQGALAAFGQYEIRHDEKFGRHTLRVDGVFEASPGCWGTSNECGKAEFGAQVGMIRSLAAKGGLINWEVQMPKSLIPAFDSTYRVDIVKNKQLVYEVKVVHNLLGAILQADDYVRRLKQLGVSNAAKGKYFAFGNRYYKDGENFLGFTVPGLDGIGLYVNTNDVGDVAKYLLLAQVAKSVVNKVVDKLKKTSLDPANTPSPPIVVANWINGHITDPVLNAIRRHYGSGSSTSDSPPILLPPVPLPAVV